MSRIGRKKNLPICEVSCYTMHHNFRVVFMRTSLFYFQNKHLHYSVCFLLIGKTRNCTSIKKCLAVPYLSLVVNKTLKKNY